MSVCLRAILVCILLAVLGASADARQWTDSSGKYTLEADLVGFDDEMVVLQRENKELGSIAIDKLSKEDQEFLKSRKALEAHDENLGKLQTWTSKSGLKVVGRVVDYARKDVTLQRRRGKTYVDDTVYGNLPDVYQTMLMKIVAHLEKTDVPNKETLEKWVRSNRGIPKTYNLEGVILELENGDEYGVPFFLFSEQDEKLLRRGYDAWLQDHGDYEKQDDHAFRLQSLAAAYHQDRQIQHQVAMLNLNMQAIQSGLTSAWEVTLYPGPGNPYPPRWVVTMGRNSEIATQRALQQNPGFISGPVRKVSF